MSIIHRKLHTIKFINITGEQNNLWGICIIKAADDLLQL